MKNILKTALFCMTALIIAAISGFVSYVITSNILGKNQQDMRKEAAKMQSPVKAVSASLETKPEVAAAESDKDIKFNYYTVKLEDDILNIYVNYEEHEELLYGEKINIGDLSDDDKTMLQEGVKLEEMSKVTELTENFTS